MRINLIVVNWPHLASIMSISFYHHKTHSDSILIRDFFHEVGVSDIIESWDFLLQNNLLTGSVEGVINNLSGCVLNMNMDSFKVLIDYLKSHEILKKIKLAVVSTNPQVIVFPALGEIEEKELKIKPFSSINAAADWIIKG
ncbi:hypothetical protein ACFLRI_03550 [Bacteroidota bacterium]